MSVGQVSGTHRDTSPQDKGTDTLSFRRVSPSPISGPDYRKAALQLLRGLLEALDAARGVRGLSLEDVAVSAGLSVRQLRNIRAGRSIPPLRTVIAITEAHGFAVTLHVKRRRTLTGVNGLAASIPAPNTEDGRDVG